MRAIPYLLAMLAGSIVACAQQPAGGRAMVISRQGGPAGLAQMQMEFVAAEFGGSVVKGAPYSAEAVTETTQTLVDGNRIHHRSTATLYRDSQGRTRREQTLDGIGPWVAPPAEPIQTIFISDPVAGVSYVLDARTRTAQKMPLPRAPQPGAVPKLAEEDVFFEQIVPPPPAAPGAGRRVIGGVQMERMVIRGDGPPGETTTQSLGKQVIEGVEAEGTRNVLTIPAEQIGNERAIEVVSERWFSPQLQTVVLSKRNDPRFGENNYRLSGINRSEPLPSLFQVPSDYTIKEGPQRMGVIARPRGAEPNK